jgi:hypothetical protein
MDCAFERCGLDKRKERKSTTGAWRKNAGCRDRVARFIRNRDYGFLIG